MTADRSVFAEAGARGALLVAFALASGCAGGGDAVSGGAIVTIEDGGLTNPGVGTLTALRLPLPVAGVPEAVEFSQVFAPNSSAAPPTSLALGPGGRQALVAGADTPGTVTLVNLSGERASVAQTIPVAADPISVAWHPGAGAALTLCRGSSELVFVEFFEDGSADATHAWPLGLLVDEQVAPSSVTWHPGGFFVAVTLTDRGQVQFFEYDEAEGATTLAPWGAPVQAGNGAVSGVWTPDGRHFVAAGDDGLSILEIAGERADDGSLEHRRTAVVPLAGSAHALAVSPNGRLILATTLGSGDEHGLLTLVEFRARTGDAWIASMHPTSRSPRAAVFDRTGRHALVADYDLNEVQVWRVTEGPRLEYTGVNVGTGAGPHAMIVVP